RMVPFFFEGSKLDWLPRRSRGFAGRVATGASRPWTRPSPTSKTRRDVPSAGAQRVGVRDGVLRGRRAWGATAVAHPATGPQAHGERSLTPRPRTGSRPAASFPASSLGPHCYHGGNRKLIADKDLPASSGDPAGRVQEEGRWQGTAGSGRCPAPS